MSKCICEGSKFKIYDENWMDDYITINDKNIMFIEGVTPCGYENTSYEIELKISYCPFCGRKLEQ